MYVYDYATACNNDDYTLPDSQYDPVQPGLHEEQDMSLFRHKSPSAQLEGQKPSQSSEPSCLGTQAVKSNHIGKSIA